MMWHLVIWDEWNLPSPLLLPEPFRIQFPSYPVDVQQTPCTSTFLYLKKRIFSRLILHTNHEVMNMIDNDELPIGFTMELAMHSDALNRFAGLSKPEQEKIVNGARTIESRQEMRNYVENMFTKG